MTVVEHDGRLWGLGRHVEHDPASLGWPAPRASQLVTVQHEHHGPVLDQGELGSCTGNAIAQALNTGPLLPAGRRLLTEQDAVAIYSWGTHHDGVPGVWPPTDTGSSGNAVAKAARHLGLIRSWTHAFGLQHCLEALVLQPVIVGIPWLSGMFDPRPDGTLAVTGDVAGGHEVALIGLDVERRDVTVLNSWGSGWGMGGAARLFWSDLDFLLRQQGDVTVPHL